MGSYTFQNFTNPYVGAPTSIDISEMFRKSGMTYGFIAADSSYGQYQGWLISSTAGNHDLQAIGRIRFSAKMGDMVSVEYVISSEQGYDFIACHVLPTDHTELLSHTLERGRFIIASGNHGEVGNYVIPADGDYFLYYQYRKDNSNSYGEDRARIKSITVPYVDKGLFVNVNNTPKKARKAYVNVNGTATKAKKVYANVNGIAKLIAEYSGVIYDSTGKEGTNFPQDDYKGANVKVSPISSGNAGMLIVNPWTFRAREDIDGVYGTIRTRFYIDDTSLIPFDGLNSRVFKFITRARDGSITLYPSGAFFRVEICLKPPSGSNIWHTVDFDRGTLLNTSESEFIVNMSGLYPGYTITQIDLGWSCSSRTYQYVEIKKITLD